MDLQYQFAELVKRVTVLEQLTSAQNNSAMLLRIEAKMDKVMSAQDDFNAAMDKLGASVDSLGTEIAALVAAHNSGNDAAFQAATARIQAIQQKLDADVVAAAGTPPTT